MRGEHGIYLGLHYMKHYPHHVGDFDRATRHLTRIERSVYRDLLDLYYDTEKQIPLDTAWVCRKIIAHSNDESTAVEQVLNEFFTETPTGWYHSRCEAEIEAYQANTSQKALAGKASAEAKRLKKLQALNGLPTAVEQPLNTVATDGSGTPTNQSTINQSTNQPVVAEQPHSPKARRKQQYPPEFLPNENGMAVAAEKRIDVPSELAKFRDYHTSKGNTMADWQAAWRTWVGNARPATTNRPITGTGETAYQRAMREKMALWTPGIAAKDPNTFDSITVDEIKNVPSLKSH